MFVGGKGDRLLRRRGRARRRLEHVLGVDPGRVPRTAAACSTTRARASGAIRRRCGARSGSTRCAARTNTISSGASHGCASAHRRACSTASISRRSASVGSSGRSTRCARRSREWEALGVDTLMLGVGAVPFQVSAPDDVELLLARVRRAPRTDWAARARARRRASGRSAEISSRRRRRMRRRSRSDAPPHTPCSMRFEQRVLEALGPHRAAVADVLGRLDPEAVGREELGRARAPATRLRASRRIPRESRPRSPPLHGALRLDTASLVRHEPWIRQCTCPDPTGHNVQTPGQPIRLQTFRRSRALGQKAPRLQWPSSLPLRSRAGSGNSRSGSSAG